MMAARTINADASCALPQTEKTLGSVRTKLRKNRPVPLDREVDQSERAVRQPGLEALVEWQHCAEMSRHSSISYATSGWTILPGSPSVFGLTY